MNVTDHDPVDAYFAAHRDRVRDEQADDLTWQRIVRASRRETRARRWTTGLGLGVAAAAAAVAGYAAWPDLMGDEIRDQTVPATSGGTVVPTTDGGTPVPTTGDDGTPVPTTGEGSTTREIPPPGETISADDPPGTVPPGMTLSSLDEAADGVLYAYGLAPEGCGDGGQGSEGCQLLVWSQDNGATWTTQADLTPLSADQVRFEGDTGWAWSAEPSAGGLLARSDDRGQTWTVVAHPGNHVLALELRSGRLTAVTGQCDAATGGCGDVQVVQDAVDATILGAGTPLQPDPGTVDQASVSYAGEAPFVQVQAAETGQRTTYRLQDGVEELAPAEGCDTVQAFAGAADADAVTPDEPAVLVCGPAGTGEDVTLSVHASAAGGRVWEPTGQVVIPDLDDRPLLATNDGERLVMATGAELRVSDDRGQSWRYPSVPPEEPAGDNPYTRLIAAGEGTLYLMSGQLDGDQGGFWRSTDDGDSWERVPVAPGS